MKSKFFSALYALNIIAQAIFDLALPAALFFALSWVLVKNAGAPEWIYAIAIPLGVLIGFYSMIKFVLSATAALSRLEEQNEKSKNDKSDPTEKQ
jgi:mannose/fructose/N-acetylgalactosamine-specific phosphotransferase system component IIC